MGPLFSKRAATIIADHEVDRLLLLMDELREAGVGLVFIFHHLEEIKRIGDRVTILRDGAAVGAVSAATDSQELVRIMVGRSIESQAK